MLFWLGFLAGVITALFVVGLARSGSDRADQCDTADADFERSFRAAEGIERVPAIERSAPSLRLVASR